MIGRKPGAVGVLSQVGEAQGLGVGDQRTEQAASLGERADRLAGGIVDADGDEVGNLASVLVEHAERAVLGVDERYRGLGDAPQHGVQVEIGSDHQHCVQELAQAPGTSVIAQHRPENTARPLPS